MFSFEICNKAILKISNFEYILGFHSNFTFNLGHRNVVMVTYIKGDVFVLVKMLSISIVSVDRFL